MNLYTYVSNDPVNATDPNGELIHLLVGAAVGAITEAAVQVVVEKKSVGDIDGKRVLASALLGSVGGNAAVLGKAAITGVLKVAGKELPLGAAQRVAAGVVGAVEGGLVGFVKGKTTERSEGRQADPALDAVGGAINALSPVPSAGSADVQGV
jgi:hypothetical protein